MRAPTILALGTFALGTDAYLTAGLLIPVAEQFGSRPAVTGQLVTAFTLAYALAGPPLAVLAARRPARTVLTYTMAVFVVANAAAAAAPSLSLLFAARIVAGAAAGVFSPLAATTAAALAPPDRRGRALSLVLAGLSAGSVAGVPAGLLLSAHGSWRAALWLVTVCGVIALAALLLALPQAPATGPPALRDRAAALRDRRVAAVVTVTFLQAVASLGAYTYLAPALGGADPVTYLCVWGAGGLLGSLGAGRLLDRGRRRAPVIRPQHLTTALLLALAVALAGFAGSPGPATALLACLVWGLAGWAFVVPQQHHLLANPAAGGAAVSLNSSATYLGGSVGSALGGVALGAGIPAGRLPLLAAGVAALGLLLAWTTVSAPASPSRSAPARPAA